MKNFPLSSNFDFFQMTESKEHPELVTENRKFALIDRDNGGPIIDNLRILCKNFLEPIYLHSGYKPTILSGFRFPKLNRAVGGSFYSWHKRMAGRTGRGAVDIALYGYGIKKLFFEIYDQVIPIKYHKMLYYKNNHFIHLSLPTGWNDQTAKLKDKGKFKVIA